MTPLASKGVYIGLDSANPNARVLWLFYSESFLWFIRHLEAEYAQFKLFVQNDLDPIGSILLQKVRNF
jgi:hypothetical protein